MDLNVELKNIITKIYKNKQFKKKEFIFPLIKNTIDIDDILFCIKPILNGQFTMDKNVRMFEKMFAEKVGSPYAVMCNSGSSANLLAFSCIVNKFRKLNIPPNSEVIIPAVCWSTSLWPILQMGLKPIFVDTNPKTLNIDLEHLKKKITSNTKVIMMVHVLGNTCNLDELMYIVNKNNLILIEDTCESLGSLYKDKYLGTFGDFGTFSFYFSHHITTGEGGMIVCKTQEDYDLLKCMRAHGWSRELSNKNELELKYKEVDKRFLFVNLGYNLRPMEISGSLGITQIKKMDEMNKNRCYNRMKIKLELERHYLWKNQIIFPEAPKHCKPIWFGFVGMLNISYKHQYFDFLNYLKDNKIENRPIISGNFIRQPAIKLLDINIDNNDFPGSDYIADCGFFIGIHTSKIEDNIIKKLVEIILSFKFQEKN